MTTTHDNKQVLVVDDEEMVARATCDMLEYLGYPSVAVNTGQEAVAFFKKHSHKISLVVLDCKLPDLSGEDVYIEIKLINPNIPVVMATGFGLDETRMTEGLHPGDEYLQKPYGLKKLNEALKRLKKA